MGGTDFFTEKKGWGKVEKGRWGKRNMGTGAKKTFVRPDWVKRTNFFLGILWLGHLKKKGKAIKQRKKCLETPEMAGAVAGRPQRAGAVQIPCARRKAIAAITDCFRVTWNILYCTRWI